MRREEADDLSQCTSATPMNTKETIPLIKKPQRKWYFFRSVDNPIECEQISSFSFRYIYIYVFVEVGKHDHGIVTGVCHELRFY